MGFEVKFSFHPRKAEGGYNTEKREEKIVKVGKAFDDIPLEKLAANIMAQLARRDIWVVDVEITELVRKKVNFKECADGKGIVIKNKKYSFDGSATIIENEFEEIEQERLQPHEMMAVAKTQSVPNITANGINPKTSLYKVLFDPAISYVNEVKKYKLTPNKEYTVHKVISHPTGKLDFQKIAITDDLNRVITLDEKYFTVIGRGLFADEELNFSGGTNNRNSKPRLAFENEMFIDSQQLNAASQVNSNIPIDDGTLPSDLMVMPVLNR